MFQSQSQGHGQGQGHGQVLNPGLTFELSKVRHSKNVYLERPNPAKWISDNHHFRHLQTTIDRSSLNIYLFVLL